MKVGYTLWVEVPADTDLLAFRKGLAGKLPDGAVLGQQWVIITEEERLDELAQSEDT